MKSATLILTGAAALAIAAGSATAGSPADTATGSMALMDDSAAPESSASMYDVDEDHDGRADRTLMLEQSDSLA